MTIGLALSAPTVGAAVSQSGQQVPAAQTAAASGLSQPGATPAIVASRDTTAGHSGSAILTALSHAGGRVESIRKLADQVGRPRSAITAEVQAMVAAGLVSMARGRHGIVVALARPT